MPGTPRKIIIYTDGGSRGNPGPSALGVVVADDKGKTVKTYAKTLGRKTNNEAEYAAVIFALEKVKALFGKEKTRSMTVEVRMDSELAVKQLTHQYKMEEERLQALFMKIWNLTIDYGKVDFVHIPREKNREADRLVNDALDKEQGGLF